MTAELKNIIACSLPNIRMIPCQQTGILSLVKTKNSPILSLIYQKLTDNDNVTILNVYLDSIYNIVFDSNSSTLLLIFTLEGITKHALFHPFPNPDDDPDAKYLLNTIQDSVSSSTLPSSSLAIPTRPATLNTAPKTEESVSDDLWNMFSNVGRFYRETATKIVKKIPSFLSTFTQQSQETEDGPPLNPWIIDRPLELPATRRKPPQLFIVLPELDELRLKIRIFTEGCHPSWRRKVWSRHLFNSSSRHEPKNSDENSAASSITLSLSSPSSSTPSAELAFCIQKDVFRTDRSEPFYYPDIQSLTEDVQRPHLGLLCNVLTTFAMDHPTLSYVQGMNDIASPILPIMEDFTSCYKVFSQIMERHGRYFAAQDNHTGEQLKLLNDMLKVTDPQLHDRLEFASRGDAPLLFAYRWLLLLFKREVGFSHFPRILETIFAAPILDYELFIALALLLLYREEILYLGYRFDLVLQFYSERAGTHNVDKLLDLADQLHQYFSRTSFIRLDPRFVHLTINYS